ncbi:hypothetical protein FB45DRAFT_282589 [Roridomyces roridus]|uniref:RRM domain-containing protein n=1 Tax=Roridomyces roridus TaxID=1738132 RepID=A0AAD7FUG2_9AGAR|nr:hypothetical protein FB45DRAFT_282589 [Roridomyces roridus]
MSSSTNNISKRLHISFTPSVPATSSEELAKSLKAQFGRFGTVKSIDGLGKQDGVGLPRKFGYVDIEGSEASITKCVNAMSGSIWKGVKVRVGDARPDFAQKIFQENASEPSPPRLKRKRGGVLAADMSLVTPESAPNRRGWKVSELGHITHPVRMRPGHPLPPPLATTVPKTKTKDVPAKPKKRRDPDSRARKRTIDVSRWGSVHLTGMFLENVGQGIPVREEKVVEEEVETLESDSDADVTPAVQVAKAKTPPPPPVVIKAAPPPIPQPQTTSDAIVDLAKEKSQTLSFLDSLFAERDEQWGGRESVDSDVDEEELLKIGGPMGTNEDDGIEFVPMELDEAEGVEEEDEEEVEAEVAPPPPAAKSKSTKLKDLFVSREEEVGFSLLSHLDLDLELDEELAHVIPSTTAESDQKTASLQLPPTAQIHTTFISPSSHVQITLDPKQPLFFPLPSSFPFATPSSSSFNTKARQQDILDVGKDNGWNAHFYRSETDEEIRKKWEEQKAELTRGWNKRWREAGKVRRRRGGVDAE